MSRLSESGLLTLLFSYMKVTFLSELRVTSFWIKFYNLYICSFRFSLFLSFSNFLTRKLHFFQVLSLPPFFLLLEPRLLLVSLYRLLFKFSLLLLTLWYLLLFVLFHLLFLLYFSTLLLFQKLSSFCCNDNFFYHCRNFLLKMLILVVLT